MDFRLLQECSLDRITCRSFLFYAILVSCLSRYNATDLAFDRSVLKRIVKSAK